MSENKVNKIPTVNSSYNDTNSSNGRKSIGIKEKTNSKYGKPTEERRKKFQL